MIRKAASPVSVTAPIPAFLSGIEVSETQTANHFMLTICIEECGETPAAQMSAPLELPIAGGEAKRLLR